MNNLKLSLLKKWELDSELSFVHSSVLLPDGTAIILTTGETGSGQREQSGVRR